MVSTPRNFAEDSTHHRCPACGRIKHLKHMSRHESNALCSRCYEKQRQGDLALQLRVKYNLTLDEYRLMLERQRGVCALCGRPPTVRAKRLHVDHDHATGKVRGLLCISCNSGLGLLKDSPALLRKAARYIEHGGNAHTTPPEDQQTLWG